jgi:hypothetical protein
VAKDESLYMHNARRETLPINVEKPLNTAVDELIVITKQLRLLSSLIAGVTLLNLFWAFYILLPYDLPTAERLLLSVHAAILLLCLLLLWLYDNRRSIGDSLFDEISDELQWYIASGHTTNMQHDETKMEQRPFLQERVTLRQYVYTTNLPLGRRRPFYYVLLNVAVWLIVTIFAILIYLGP